jgi:prolyl-tRNA editing enzyme YbaK/EbsC (Cys-tRNA(Pro) deacylase)
MVAGWPEAVERVASFLRSAGAEARVEEFREPTPTAADAARVVGCDLSQIVKSLVFDCDGRAVLVLVPGDRRVDPRRLLQVTRAESASIAGPERVRDATGFAPGGVAPFALRAVSRVLVDRTLLTHDVVWVGAGSPRHLAAVTPAELVRLAHADTVDTAA